MEKLDTIISNPNTRPGYKKSKLGWIPEDWDAVKLENLGVWKGGGTPSKSNLIFWKNGTIPWVSPKDMKSLIIESTQDYITEDAVRNSSTNLIPEESILIVNRSGILRNFAPIALNNIPVAINQDLKSLTVNSDSCVGYIFNYLLGFNQKFLLETRKEGTTVESLDFDSIKKFRIHLPPLPEQRRIAAILSTWDKAIDTLQNLIAKKQERKKGLMQVLLTGKLRFDGFVEDWRKARLSDIGKVVSGGTPDTKNKSFWDGHIDWCTPTEITALNGKYLGHTKRKISELGLKKSSASLLPKNSIVVCTRATIGALAITLVPMTTNQGFKSLILKSVDVEFTYYKLLTMKWKMLKYSIGSTFKEISKRDFENLRLDLPKEIEEQQKIASVLSAADKEIEKLQSQLEKLKEQKKGLMQKLLTGEVRVKV